MFCAGRKESGLRKSLWIIRSFWFGAAAFKQPIPSSITGRHWTAVTGRLITSPSSIKGNVTGEKLAPALVETTRRWNRICVWIGNNQLPDYSGVGAVSAAGSGERDHACALPPGSQNSFARHRLV